MMRVVLDTNVVLVMLARTNPYHAILQAFEEERFIWLLSHDILLEYEEIFKQRLSTIYVDEILEILESDALVVRTDVYYNWHLIHADPDDNKFVDCAVAGDADYLVTNDAHFNVLASIPFPKVNVLRAEQFIDLLSQTVA